MPTVMLPPSRAILATKPSPTGSVIDTNTTGTVRLACESACGHGSCMADNQIRLHLYEFFGERARTPGIAGCVTISELNIPILCPSQLLERAL
jgi:hypothetical protein